MTGPSQARRLAAWAVVLVAVVSGCGAPASGPEASGPPAVQQVDGAQAFAANCAVCHGPDGEGTEQGPPLVHVIYEPGHHSDESFRRAVREGVVAHHWDYGPMPPQPQVEDAELEAIIAHVRALQRDAGIID